MHKIQILGTGCPKCEQLAQNVQAAAQRLGMACDFEKVTQIEEIMKFGVMMTPGLVIDGDVKSTGKVPSVDDIQGLLAEAAGQPEEAGQ